MIAQTPGKIFLADQRGHAETSNFRRYSTFSFGDYAHPDKAPFGRLAAFNEETLAARHTLELPVREASYILLLPITGVLTFSSAPGHSAAVDASEIQLVAMTAGSFLRLSNRYDGELISFLHVWFTADETIVSTSFQALPFDLAAAENQLVRLALPSPEAADLFSISIGRFAGRSEALYELAPEKQFFAFVLAGAFEIEGRLLHERDGLALWQVASVELEALSNHAIVILLEFS